MKMRVAAVAAHESLELPQMRDLAATLNGNEVRLFGVACNHVGSVLPINCDSSVRVLAWKPMRLGMTPSFVPSFICSMGPIGGITIETGLNSDHKKWEYLDEGAPYAEFASAVADFNLEICNGSNVMPLVRTTLPWPNLPTSKDKQPKINILGVTKIMAFMGSISRRGNCRWKAKDSKKDRSNWERKQQQPQRGQRATHGGQRFFDYATSTL
jgi:hypothetical protein